MQPSKVFGFGLASVIALQLHAVHAQDMGEAALIYPTIENNANGNTEFYAGGVSADGTIVVGVADYFNDGHVVRWGADDGFSTVSTLNNPSSKGQNTKTYQPFNNANVNISGDGNVISVNLRWQSELNFNSIAAIHRGGQWHLLNDPEITYASVSGLSFDGDYAAGRVGDQAVRWHYVAGEYSEVTELGYLWNGAQKLSTAHDISDNGSVVVGSSAIGVDNRNRRIYGAFIWSQNTMTRLPDPFSPVTNANAVAFAISGDGAVAVGYANNTTNELFESTQAVKWQLNALNQYDDTVLPYLAGNHNGAAALDANQDGSVIVGYSGFNNGRHFAVRWTDNGALSVTEWLEDNGVVIGASAPVLAEAHGVSADGNTIVGVAYEEVGEGEGASTKGRAFIATLNGFILPDGETGGTGQTLTGSGYRPTVASTNSLLQHGAHSQPMQRRVAKGKTSLWAAGDIGRDDHTQNDGEISLAEIGVAHSYDDSQINLSIGSTWVDQNLVQGGSVDADSLFIMGEVITPLDMENVFLTLSSFYQWGDATITRGYINAGLPDFSRGTPDTKGWGVRGRIDAVNAYQFGTAGVSPYVDISYAHTTIDAYTETGGGFPAMFNAYKEKRTEGRLGLNAEIPAGDGLTLLANGEVAHRFQNNTGTTSGQLIGLFAFNFENPDVDQTWVKGGLGVTADMAGGKFFLMGNATTQGSMPSMWLATSYLMNF